MEENVRNRYDELIKKYERLKRLAERPGNEHEGKNARILLKKLKEKIEAIGNQYGLSYKDVNKNNTNSSTYSQQQRTYEYHPNYSNCSGQRYSQNPYGTDLSANRRDNFESEEDKLRRLGIIYVIFGENMKFGTFLVHFLETIKLEKDDWEFCKVKCDIFENDRIVCHNVVISFWPFNYGDSVCGDMNFAIYGDGRIYEYNGANGYAHYKPLTDYMKYLWNGYFSNNKPRLTKGYDGYFGFNQTGYYGIDDDFGFSVYGGNIISYRRR